MMRNRLIIILLFPFLASAQQEWEEIDPAVFFDVVQDSEKAIPEGQSYSFISQYKIYNDYTDENPVETFTSELLCRNGKELNVFHINYYMIQDKSLNLTIDSINKQLIVQPADTSFFYRKTIQDYADFLLLAKKIHRKKENGTTRYDLELKPGHIYKAIEFVFSNQNFISQITIYSNSPYTIENNISTDAKAKIVIDFEDFKTGRKVDFNDFKTISDFIIIEGYQISSLEKYKEFEVIDLRTKNNQK